MRRLLLPSCLCLTAALAAQQRDALTDGWEIAPASDARPVSGWRPVTVPAAFETALGTDYDGVAWYRRTLAVDPAWRDATVRVEFHGVATDATVFVNGERVGHHLGGWTPFSIDVTAALRSNGEDLLEVRVDEKVGHNTQGFLPVVQPHFGGVWQDVFLCVDTGPVLDRIGLFTFGDGAAGQLQVAAPILTATTDDPLRLRVEVLDGAAVVAAIDADAAPARTARLTLGTPDVRLWRPGAPHLYRVRLILSDDNGRTLDEVERRVGFRDLDTRGSTILWNGSPLQLRGVLHWGYSPPHLAPPTDRDWWRRQLEDFRAMGCNLVKCCLWVPPRAFYEVCDELGLLVWQEYPTWHPQFTEEHRADLLAEFNEFFRYDRSHAAVAFRSLTCETGQTAELRVIQDLYDAAHAAIPDTLVVDDSSWIGWQRVHDFWDDHPYGNNSWWPGKLESFRQHLADNRPLPLLLGECITGDTWVPLQGWQERHGDGEQPWWRPDCLVDQVAFESWLTAGYGRAVLESLRLVSLDYAMRNRKYQIERLRLAIPATGYVMSVARDIGKCRMGFYDDLDRLKWQPADWSWHADTMVGLDTAVDRRAFVGSSPELAVRIAHSGRGPLRGQLRLRLRVLDADVPGPRFDLRTEPGAVSDRLTWTPDLAAVQRPRRFRLWAELTGSHPANNAWDLWLLPPSSPKIPDGVRVVQALDSDTLAFVEGGGRVLLQVTPKKHSLRADSLWFLRGAPFAPPHPVHSAVPAELLLELQTFDLEQPFVMPWEHLLGQVDPILAYWETHDIAEVRRRLFAFDCRVGRGRLLATALNHDSPAGRFVQQCFLEHLAGGPAPQRALSRETLAALRGTLTAEARQLSEWRVRTDPDDRGLRERWQDPGLDDEEWRVLRAGAHWESQGLEHYDGIAWYRIALDVPTSWRGKTVRAVFEGVDDSYHLFVNGTQVARFGDPEKNVTVWLQRTYADVTAALRPGARNVIALRIVDHNGAGGMWKPAFLTTGPADSKSQLLN